MALLRLREIPEQPADPDILTLFGRFDIEALGFELHRRGFLADGIERQVLGQPYWTPAQKSFDVVSANWRKVAAKTLLVHFQQHVAVAFFLLRHLFEYLCRFRITPGEIFGEAHVDAAVFLLGGDRNGEHFALGQIGEFLHQAFPTLSLERF